MRDMWGRVSLCVVCSACLLLSTICWAYETPQGQRATTRITSSAIDKEARRAQQRQVEGRPVCHRCRRPLRQCLCDCLPAHRLTTETRVVILQHTSEFRRRKSVSTVPLLSLVLKNVTVAVGESFRESSILQHDMSNSPRPLLLFPGDNAVPLDVVKESVSMLHPSHTLVIVDGTWSQASSILRKSKSLVDRCQSVQLTKGYPAGTECEPSIYGAIRREPRQHFVSTLEACARALTLLEPNNPNVTMATKHLHCALRKMVSSQLQYNQSAWQEGNTSSKSREDQKCPNLSRAAPTDNLTQTNRTRHSRVEKEFNTSEAFLRPLTLEDAPFVDSTWLYRSTRSLGKICRQILSEGGYCMGVEYKGKLIAFILRHQNGAVGMLHVEEAHRRQGYGALLVGTVTSLLLQQNQSCFAYILAGNEASEQLFQKQGWALADEGAKRKSGTRRNKRLWIFPPSP